MFQCEAHPPPQDSHILLPFKYDSVFYKPVCKNPDKNYVTEDIYCIYVSQ